MQFVRWRVNNKCRHRKSCLKQVTSEQRQYTWRGFHNEKDEDGFALLASDNGIKKIISGQ